MQNKNILKLITLEVENIFKNAKSSHDLDHTLRVLNIAKHIAKKEKANLEIVELAVLLHDIGREQEFIDKTICHAKYGAKLAEKILNKYNYDKENIKQVVYCIKSHRFRENSKENLKTIEAKVLFDADKIDCIGAIGIGRAFIWVGEYNAKLDCPELTDFEIINNKYSYTKEDTAYREYLLKLKEIHKKLFTKEGKKIAKDRSKFMDIFFKRFKKEIFGKL